MKNVSLINKGESESLISKGKGESQISNLINSQRLEDTQGGKYVSP